jgi:uncharacterized protein (DUF1697 family)
MKYIALLRGINVAGKNKIKMADLKKLFESIGFNNVTTYIQSGNVIFESSMNEKELPSTISKAIADSFTLIVPVQVRKSELLGSIVENCPFPQHDLVEEGTRVLVTFLEQVPSQEKWEELEQFIKTPERLILKGQELYLHCPNGYGKTKLNNNFIEKKLAVSATTRNIKSVIKLRELSQLIISPPLFH